MSTFRFDQAVAVRFRLIRKNNESLLKDGTAALPGMTDGIDFTAQCFGIGIFAGQFNFIGVAVIYF